MGRVFAAAFSLLRKFLAYTVSIYRLISRLPATISSYLTIRLYQSIPKHEGEIDPDLAEVIDEGMLFLGVRLRTFIDSVGNLVIGSFLVTVGYFLIGIPVVLALQLLDLSLGISPSGILLTLVMLLIGLIVFIAMLLLGTADILLVLYVGALTWFGIQQMRKSLRIKSGVSTQRYWYTIEREKAGAVTEEIYRDNLAAFYRMGVYAVIAFLLVVIGLALPDFGRWLRENPIINLTDESTVGQILSLFGRIVEVIDFLIPIDIIHLFDFQNAGLLLHIVAAFLVFAIFLNGKRIAQHSTRSKLPWSEIEEYSAWGEYERAKITVMVSIHQLLEGGHREQFETVGKHLIQLVMVILFAAGLNALYGSILINM